MSESNEYILKTIQHYQQCLDKYTPQRNESKLLHCIGKLHKLNIKVTHLEETGIGRTVNALRKIGGLVGDASKSLVAKWKEIVVEEKDMNAQPQDTDPSEKEYESKEKKHKHSSSHKESDKEKIEIKQEKNKTSSSNSKSNSGSSSSRSSSKTDKDRSSKHDKESDRHKSEKHKRHYESVSESEGSSNSESEEEEQPVKKQIKLEEDNYSKHKSSSSKSHEDSTSRKHRTSEKSSSSKHKSKRSTDSDSSDGQKYSKGKHKSSNDEDEEDSDSDSTSMKLQYKQNRNRDSSSENEDFKHKSTKHEYKSTKHSKESSTSSHKHKNKHSDKNKNGEKEDKKSSSLKNDQKRDKEKIDTIKKHSSNKHEKKPSKTEEYKKSETKDKSKSPKDRNSSNSKSNKPKINFEFDMFSVGDGFGDDSSSKNKSGNSTTKKKHSSTKDNHSEKINVSSSREIETINTDEKVPSLLKEAKLEPLDINISSLLPSITPNYRPLGNFPIDSPLKKNLTEEEALSISITSKNQRTKVYSGNKVLWGKVPSLFEICIRILQDNIDALEYTGGVPYLILKPVLEKATPDQLFVLEHHNPNLIEDSDELWLLHCQKDFRNKQRLELETWREMYMRCLDERDAKLKALTENIKISQEKSTPLRATKLAYVDDYVKPPRNIAKKQARNGTAYDKKPSVTPSSRLAALATAGEAGKVAVPNPGARAAERSTASHALKPKKAPLMAKTLSLFKNRFRR